ncbi:MAG: hypothetical protein V1921_03695 [Candidatus Altiarchaeota archaeon]
MIPKDDKTLKLLLIGLASAAIVLRKMPLAALSLAMLGILLLSERASHPITVRKVKYNKDTGRFEVFVENKGSKPLTVNYAIRSVQPEYAESVGLTDEDGIEFLRGSSGGYRENFSLISAEFPGKTLGACQAELIEAARMAPEDGWDPALQKTVRITAAYTGEDMDAVRKLELTVPVEVSENHPYLRKVGAEREFVLSDGYGVAGRAASLEALADHVRGKSSHVLAHVRNEDIQRWVMNVVGDSELSDRISKITSLPDEQILDTLEETLRERILELRYGHLVEKHPLLADVEPWHAFHMKSDHENIIGVCRSLSSLLELIRASPEECVGFHLRGDNDFSKWVANTVGDLKLSDRIDVIDASDMRYAKLKLISLLEERIRELEG